MSTNNNTLPNFVVVEKDTERRGARKVSFQAKLGNVSLDWDIWGMVCWRSSNIQDGDYEVFQLTNRKTGRWSIKLHKKVDSDYNDKVIESGDPSSTGMGTQYWKDQFAEIVRQVNALLDKWREVNKAEEEKSAIANALWAKEQEANLASIVKEGFNSVLSYVKDKINVGNWRDEVTLGSKKVGYENLSDFFRTYFPGIEIQESGDFSECAGCTFDMELTFPGNGKRLVLWGERGEDNTDARIEDV